MRYAIVESGGKQYRVIEGRTLEVDRLAIETGEKFGFDRILLMVDDDDVMVGTPILSGVEVNVTVVDHTKGPKIDRFKYRPKKRIRVRGGHRQHFTRLLVDFIGKPGEERTLAPHASAGEVEEQELSNVEVVDATDTPVSVEADDLTLIEGIGPKVAKVLGEAGILTFSQLAEANADDVQKILNEAGLKMMDATSWPAQAKLAADDDMDGLKKMQDKLSGGRKVKTEKKPAAKKSTRK
ncbi:MAG: 50S ribosomal protein L21 [Chloroflexota bacterium]|nr:50S ribosomal protein L21 [Chloroflexota bacterium]